MLRKMRTPGTLETGSAGTRWRGVASLAGLVAVAIVVLSLGGQLFTAAGSAAAGQQTSDVSAVYEVRIDVGSASAFTDHLGNVWQADRAYSPGTTTWGYTGGTTMRGNTGVPVAGTLDDSLYYTYRMWRAQPGGYTFEAPNGVYEVNLGFAAVENVGVEFGYRRFDVDINGVKHLCMMDIISAAGTFAAYDWTFVVTVTNGILNVNFTPQTAPNWYYKEAQLNALHVKALPDYVEPAPVLYPQLGAGMLYAYGTMNSYDFRPLHLGWYNSWGTRPTYEQPFGIEYVQLVTIVGGTNWTVLEQAVQAHPGNVWIIGNEDEVRFTPEAYAQTYKTVREFIRHTDPTARTAVMGIFQVSEARLYWLSAVVASYKAQFGVDMPVDVWTIHEQITAEAPNAPNTMGGWPMGVPTTVPAEWHGTNCNDSMSGGPNDLAAFKGDIFGMRQWMISKGYGDKELWISEYGVLFPEDYNCTEKRIGTYLQGTMDFLWNTTSITAGLAADNYHLVQKWMWYSMNDEPFKQFNNHWNGALYYYACPAYPGAMTGIGHAMMEWANSITPPGPTPTPTETRTPTITPTPTATRTPLPPGNGSLQGAVQFMGRGSAPAVAWQLPMVVKLFVPGDSIPVYQFEVTTDQMGAFSVPGTATPGIFAGDFDVKVKNAQMLQVVAPAVGFTDTAATARDFGLLKSGDANDDNRVSLTDLSILSATFGKAAADAGYDGRADFSGDARVSLTDLTLLSSSFGQQGVSVVTSAGAALQGVGLAAAPTASFSVSPASNNVAINKDFSVDVYLTVTGGQLGGASFWLAIDPTYLQVLNVSCFSPIAGVSTVPICQYVGGQAQYGLSVTDPSKYAGTGNFKIMTIQMRTLALTAGTSLQFTNKLNDAVCGPGCVDYSAAAGYTNGTVVITNPPTPTRTPTLCFGCPTPTPTPTQPPLSIRINAGGSAYTDRAGNPWVADKAWTPGSWGYVGGGGQTYASDTPVSGTQDSALYQSERYGMSEFRFDVSPGVYSVTLKFAEIYYRTKPGDRIFTVMAEGNAVVTNLDVMAVAGGQNIALDRAFLVTVNDSQLNLEFVAVTSNAKINAMQVLYVGGSGPTATATATATPTRTATSAVSLTPTPSATASRTATATPTPRDPYERNDSFDQAFGIERNRDYLGYVESPDDNDYFRFTVSDPAAFIWVALTDLPADFDLFLFQPDRTLVAWSNYGGRASEHILDYAVRGVTGEYYLLVAGYSKAYDSGQPYRLRIDLHALTPTPTRVANAFGYSDAPAARSE